MDPMEGNQWWGGWTRWKETNGKKDRMEGDQFEGNQAIPDYHRSLPTPTDPY
jgi:hypothetical protein